jgi:hypothetical protein
MDIFGLRWMEGKELGKEWRKEPGKNIAKDKVELT